MKVVSLTPWRACGAQAFFQQTNAAGISVHSHLTELIQSLLLSNDPTAFENIENFSLDIKKKHFSPAEPGLKVRLLLVLL